MPEKKAGALGGASFLSQPYRLVNFYFFFGAAFLFLAAFFFLGALLREGLFFAPAAFLVAGFFLAAFFLAAFFLGAAFFFVATVILRALRGPTRFREYGRIYVAA